VLAVYTTRAKLLECGNPGGSFNSFATMCEKSMSTQYGISLSEYRAYAELMMMLMTHDGNGHMGLVYIISRVQ
jgi:hypothetical protein